MPTLVVGMWIVAVVCLRHGHASVLHGTPTSQRPGVNKAQASITTGQEDFASAD